ncbi:MAG: TonB-dependent receptor [Bacteroidetes bacterium]|nr:TonB-dependent receptor [Bacteroidota bacterium]
MKKKIIKRNLIAFLMKISVIMLLIVLGAGITYGRSGLAQELLKRTVTIDAEQRDLKSVLNQLEKSAKVRFSYVPTLVRDQKVSLTMHNQPLEEVLVKILRPLRIQYSVSGNYIILNRDSNSNKPIPTPSSSSSTNETTFVEEILPVDRTVSGKVVDEKGVGLPGVNILLKGTTRGMSTNADGNFQMTVPDGVQTLVFSFVGYLPKEAALSAQQTSLNIQLEVDQKALEEVVVVGYGVQKKSTLTGSVVSVSGKDIVKSPAVNVTNSLQGRLPGVIATNRTGEPGRDDAQILIRGRSTFGNNQPLLVIDGVPRPTEGLGRIDPQSIESITVLKDGAAAIYGARAANGVILVETKRGVEGKPRFDFSYNQGFSQPTRILKLTDAVEHALARNEAAVRNGMTTMPFSNAEIELFRNGSDPNLYPNTDWVKETLKPWTPQNKMNLTINGGSQRVLYFFNVGMLNQDGHFVNNPTNYKQYEVRANIDANINSNMRVSLNIAGRLEKRMYPSTGTWVNFVNILSALPTIPARYPNGLIAAGRLGENPLLRDQVGYLSQERLPIQSTLSAQYKVPFIKGMTVDASYSFDFTHDFNKTFQKPYSYWQYVPATQDYINVKSTFYANPSVQDYFGRVFAQTYNLRLGYAKTIGSHSIDAMVGAERAQNSGNNFSASRRNFPTTTLLDLNFGGSSLSDLGNSGSSFLTRRDNYFGRAGYNYKEKYLAEFLFRYDGSPIFPEDKRYGFFPGASVGWVVSQEPFMSSLSSVDRLKVRASYGELGNDNISDAYAYLRTYSIGRSYNFGGVDVLGLSPGVLPNQNYTWEVLKTINLGLEASLWKSKLGIEFDIFSQKRSSILAARQLSISDTYGFSALPPENIGKVSNYGFELILSHRNNIGGLNYSAKGNISFARNKYVYFDEVPKAAEYQNQTGKPIGAPLIWATGGIYRTQEEIDNSVHLPTARVGDVIYLDYNGDGVINNNDQYRLNKSETPEIVFGMDMSANYKDFDLNLFFQGQGNAVYFPGITGLGGASNSAAFRAKDRWTPENPNGSMPRSGGNFPQMSEFNMYKATFVRLKTLEIGYRLPQKLLSKVGLSNLRVYTNAFNLFTLSSVSFMDPEGRGDGADLNSTRTDANYYPQLKVFNFGVNLSF